ncbi:MAG: hypothetical protein IPP91_08520 [Betaproteobacteria bacterium]|nr:hypothetical protein [Betaproteobacteria bacterium]
MKRLLLASLLACALPAAAGDFPLLGSLSQSQFRSLSEDLGAALSYKGVTPATPLGLTGFDIGLEVSATEVTNSGVFSLAGNGSPDYIAVPKLHIYKGLPGGFDIGAFVGAASNVNATVFGLDARYAVLADGITTPAVALRASGTVSSDMGGVRISTLAADVMVSKVFTVATPYIGAGVVRTAAEANGTSLSDEQFSKSRVFVGLNVNLAILNLAFEVEKLGSNNTLSAKAGWRF